MDDRRTRGRKATALDFLSGSGSLVVKREKLRGRLPCCRSSRCGKGVTGAGGVGLRFGFAEGVTSRGVAQFLIA